MASSGTQGSFRNPGPDSLSRGAHDLRPDEAPEPRQEHSAWRGVLRSELLLVEDPGALELVAFRVGSAGGDGAALAVGREDDAAGHGHLAALLAGEFQGAVVDLLVGP